MKAFFACFAFGLALVFLMFPNQVRAQEPVSSAVTVEPASLDFDLTEDTASSIVVITNQHDYTVTMSAQLKAIDELAGRIIPTGDIRPELAAVLKLSETEISIEPNSRYYLTVSAVDNPALEAGGHYATLLLRDVTASKESGAINSQVSVGIFVVKPQGDVKQITVTKRQFTRSTFAFPTRALIELYNDGNVHVVPRGYLRIYDADYVYYESIFNMQSTTILPTQRFSEERNITVSPGGWRPRKVTIEVGYRTDGTDKVELYSEQFWYVPLYLIPLPLGLAVLALVFSGKQYLKRRAA